ncbi:MAG TPA: orotidine-5'-phosphate decarboxylase [Nitrospiraceae bacterium]|jgi:orotidine-5'-phosphate decarboxylase|nr:orotidine-5'-phosphate decarboxylase [Nitrospiraceae bacterium]
MPAKEKIILALDVSDAAYAIDIVERFREHVNIFKVGLELFVSAGPQVVEEIHRKEKKVFLDLKFHDIPNTVSKAALAAVRLGVYMFNIHTTGGVDMMKRCKDSVVEVCLREDVKRPKILGVTVLTGLTQEALKNELGIQHGIKTHVKQLSKLAHEAGLDGVVASGHEAGSIRNHFGKDFLIVIPGIRTSWSPPDDQRRTVTPREALREGADYIVLGRAVLNQPDPLRALDLITTEILTA